jgi:hypothetical protein
MKLEEVLVHAICFCPILRISFHPGIEAMSALNVPVDDVSMASGWIEKMAVELTIWRTQAVPPILRNLVYFVGELFSKVFLKKKGAE